MEMVAAEPQDAGGQSLTRSRGLHVLRHVASTKARGRGRWRVSDWSRTTQGTSPMQKGMAEVPKGDTLPAIGGRFKAISLARYGALLDD